MQSNADKEYDPLELLELAKELSQSSEESKLRTAVGRAYYAIFLIARERMRLTSEERIHATVSHEISLRAGRMVKERYDDMKELHRVADYELRPIDPEYRDWRDNWNTQQTLANSLLPKVQSLPAHRTR